MNPIRKKVRRAPAWVITFADLVTVLLAFFVLMLSFSSPDPNQYRQVSDSMATAFADDLGGVFDRVSLARLGIHLSSIRANRNGDAAPVGPRPDERLVRNGPLKTYLRLTATLRREIESEIIRVALSDRALVIRFSDLAFFSPGTRTLGRT